MSKLSQDAEHALKLPVGVVSPLWVVFAGAALTGAAFYWARNWLKPTNLEAELPAVPLVVAETVTPVIEAAEATLQTAVETAEPVVEDAVGAVELAVEDLSEIVEEAAASLDLPGDDLTRLTGIGPKLAASLAERGVTRFADIAGWTADDIARLDKDLKLMGRIEREAWIAQARRFADAVAN